MKILLLKRKVNAKSGNTIKRLILGVMWVYPVRGFGN